MKQPLIILTGPTAVGKTALSIRLAKAIGGEIISADSMQVYRHMDIGSAKVTKEEMDGVPHHLIDVLEPEEEFNVVVFKQMAAEALTASTAAETSPSWPAEPDFISRLCCTTSTSRRTRRAARSAQSWKRWPAARAISGCTPCCRRSIPKRPGRSTPTTSSG